MSLADLIRKHEYRGPASDNSAKAANDGRWKVAPLAGIAALAFANPTETKMEKALTSWGWLLHFADRESLETYHHPDVTHAEVLLKYPNALAAEPISERARRTPTEAEATELVVLVQAIGTAIGWSADDIERALDGALADPDGAFACYRSLVVEHGIILPLDDDRRTCNQCANLTGRRCIAATQGEVIANLDYRPIRDASRRCVNRPGFRGGHLV
jgi:hypothetical protein